MTGPLYLGNPFTHSLQVPTGNLHTTSLVLGYNTQNKTQHVQLFQILKANVARKIVIKKQKNPKF